MKAAILRKVGIVPKVEQVYLPQHLEPGQVLVRVLVSGLCGAQIHEINGHKGNAKFMPHMLGHEGCGIVEDVGAGVTTVSTGDKVVMHWRKSGGIEAPFPKYFLENGDEMSAGKITTLSEFSIVSENRVTTVPADTDEYLCALLGCGMTTALGAVNNDAKIKFGESVLIVGCGGVGLNLIQGSLLASAYPVVGLDIKTDKQFIVENIGATHFLDKIDDLDQFDKFDVIMDTTGNVNAIYETMKFLGDSGRYILVGQPKPGQDIKIPDGVSWWSPSGKSIIVSQGGKTNPQNDLKRYVKMHKAGILDIDKIITAVYSIDGVDEAFELLMSGIAGRVMVKMDHQ